MFLNYKNNTYNNRIYYKMYIVCIIAVLIYICNICIRYTETYINLSYLKNINNNLGYALILILIIDLAIIKYKDYINKIFDTNKNNLNYIGKLSADFIIILYNNKNTTEIIAKETNKLLKNINNKKINNKLNKINLNNLKNFIFYLQYIINYKEKKPNQEEYFIVLVHEILNKISNIYHKKEKYNDLLGKKIEEFIDMNNNIILYYMIRSLLKKISHANKDKIKAIISNINKEINKY